MNTLNSLPKPQTVNLGRFGDWTSWFSWLILLLLLPFSVLSVAGFTWLPALLLPGDFLHNLLLLTAIYFAVLPIVFIPGFDWLQIKLCAPDSRQPTPQERSHLRPAWAKVQRRVGKDLSRQYTLLVVDSDNLNAYAGGGRLMVVTTQALCALEPDELEAVLSHELGHHVGMHPVVLLAQAWLTRPILWFHTLLRLIYACLAGITKMTSGYIWVALTIVTLVPRCALEMLSNIYRFATWTLRFFGRHAEYQADLTAVQLGYGPVLIEALDFMRAFDDEDEVQPDSRRLTRFKQRVPEILWSTHPPTTKRIKRIKERLMR